MLTAQYCRAASSVRRHTISLFTNAALTAGQTAKVNGLVRYAERPYQWLNSLLFRYLRTLVFINQPEKAIATIADGPGFQVP